MDIQPAKHYPPLTFVSLGREATKNGSWLAARQLGGEVMITVITWGTPPESSWWTIACLLTSTVVVVGKTPLLSKLFKGMFFVTILKLTETLIVYFDGKTICSQNHHVHLKTKIINEFFTFFSWFRVFRIFGSHAFVSWR